MQDQLKSKTKLEETQVENVTTAGSKFLKENLWNYNGKGVVSLQ